MDSIQKLNYLAFLLQAATEEDIQVYNFFLLFLGFLLLIIILAYILLTSKQE